MSILKAAGPSVAVIHFNASKTARLRSDEIEHLAYHVVRLLSGQGTAASEWVHLGFSVEVEPGSYDSKVESA
jgi:hypothetical protein